ncbi:WD40 repeat-like protein [Scleroderma citrinum]
MAAAEVINHAPLVLPQPKDIPLPSSHYSLLPQSTKRSKKKDKQKENSSRSHPGESSGADGHILGGSKKPENPSPRRWNWTSLTDANISSHPPVFTRDGNHFLSVVGSTIKIHSTSSGKVVSTLPRPQDEGHTDVITSAILSAQNSFQLITGSLDGTIKIWDFLEGVLLRTIDLDQPIHHICTHEKTNAHVFVAAAKHKIKAQTTSANAQEESCIVLRVSLKHQGSGSATKSQKSSQVLPIGKTKRTTGLAISASGERLIAIAGYKAYVAQIAALKSGFMKFVSPETLTCLAVHPSEEYFATGDVNGVVRLWYCLDPNLVKVVGVEKKSQTSALHWHAHAVSSVAFTTNGAYLLSGGEEAVLVIWQLHTGKREFVPRVGSPIKSIAVSPPRASEEEYFLGLADATHAFVSSMTLKLSRVFARIRIDPSLSLTTAVPSSSSAPLAFHSLSETVVLRSSHPSSLQTFSPSSSALVAELEVSPSNRVSRRDEKMLEPSRVERTVISFTGEWMATIDRREGDEYFRSEIYLKFWSWDKKNALWILNTRIDRPHGLHKVTSMSFSPDTSTVQLVTTGADGKLKCWRIQTVKDKRGNQEVSWVPRSSFGFESNILRHASWCPDGSLLAVALGTSVILYDPRTNVAQHTFICRESSRPQQAHFIGPSGRFLAVISGLDLVVWNVVSQSVLWHFRNDRPFEIVEPHPHRDAFITVHSTFPHHAVVTIFHARSPLPQMVHTLPFAIRNLVWHHRPCAPAGETFSLIGLTQNYSLILMGDAVDAKEGPSATAMALQNPAPPKKSLFEEMFGVPIIASLPAQQPPNHPTAHPGAVLPWRGSETASFFDAPSHLMPPIDTFFDSLVDGFLHLRTTDAEPQPGPDFQPEDEATMSVDEEPDLGKSTDILAEQVLHDFTPVFKEIAESCDYPPEKALIPSSTGPVLAKSPKSASRTSGPHIRSSQSSPPSLKQRTLPPGSIKAGKKRSRPSHD